MKKYVSVLAGLGLAATASVGHAQQAEGAIAEPQADAGLGAEPAPATPAESAVLAAEAPANGADAAASEEAATQGAATPRARSALIEEIVVTAQKREENLANVPISIQAFSPEALSARGIESQLGLARAVPSLDVGSQAGYATIFLRGIGTEAFLTADPSIASYVDGVYFPFSPTFVQNFAGVERVEVLKGPQGTLFGRNAVGGAISVTSLSPDFHEAKTTIDVSAGNYNLINPRVYTNIPVTDNFAVNLSAFYSHGDSYLDGESQGKPLRKNIDQGVRIKARWEPMEDLDVQLGWVRTKSQNNGAIGQNLNPTPLGQVLTIRPPEDKYRVDVDERLYGVSETSVQQAQVSYTGAPWFDIKLLGSEQRNKLLYNYDFDGTSLPLVSFDVPGHPAHIQQGELQLISNDTLPGNEWLKLTGGVFWFQNVQGFDPVQLTVANIDPRVPGTIIDNLGVADLLNLNQELLDGLDRVGSLLDNLPGDPLPDGRFYRVDATGQVYTKSIGYYLQTTINLTDWWALTLGGRYQDEDRGVHRSTTSVIVYNTDPVEQILGRKAIVWEQARADGGTVPNHDVTKGFQPKVSMDFHPFDDDTLVFASWQKAEKAHAYNAFAVYLPPQYIRPEKTTAYEIGLRTKLFDGAMRLNTAIFRYDIKDQQTQYVSLITGGALAFENAPKARSQGIDFDVITEVFPSYIDGLVLSLNGAFLDTEFVKYPNASGFDPATGLFRSNMDFTGNKQTRSPDFSGSVAVTKLWDLGSGEFEIGTDYYYNSGFYYSASNDPRYEQEAYGLLGAFARYRYNPQNIEVRVFGNNLTDKFYTQGVISTDFGGIFTIAPPVLYGLKVSWEF